MRDIKLKRRNRLTPFRNRIYNKTQLQTIVDFENMKKIISLLQAISEFDKFQNHRPYEHKNDKK